MELKALVSPTLKTDAVTAVVLSDPGLTVEQVEVCDFEDVGLVASDC